ncbi:MAG: STAS-like domain-containing protein [Patescibacteria group bacterium]|jgi:hypothetical protein
MNINERILELSRYLGVFRTAQIVHALKGEFSRQYVARHIAQLVGEGKLVKQGSTRGATYALPEHAHELTDRIQKRLMREGLKEHEVFDEIQQQAPFLRELPENVRSIFYYAFSEMLNNAIDHSQSKQVEVSVEEADGTLLFTVNDFGVGVFRNVMRQRGLKSELDAIQDLLKGKLTTQPKAHSGEGIFFTSRVADLFLLESFGYRLRVDNRLPDVFVEEVPARKKGTRVRFSISAATDKHLNDIFRKYQTDPSEYAFDTTEVRIKLYTLGTIHISRSQARRVTAGLEKFRRVILDFDQVPTIGQAFADEIFRVFANQHPEIELIPENANEPVQFMIGRVRQSE